MPDQNEIFDAAVRILLLTDRCVTISIAPGGVSIRLPTTRKLAEYLRVPHYYVLPAFAEMERDGLLRRMERVGISTTPRGTTCILRLMDTAYADAAEEVLGRRMLTELLAKAEEGRDQPMTVRYERRAPTTGDLQSPVPEGEDKQSTVSD